MPCFTNRICNRNGWVVNAQKRNETIRRRRTENQQLVLQVLGYSGTGSKTTPDLRIQCTSVFFFSATRCRPHSRGTTPMLVSWMRRTYYYIHRCCENLTKKKQATNEIVINSSWTHKSIGDKSNLGLERVFCVALLSFISLRSFFFLLLLPFRHRHIDMVDWPINESIKII